MKRHLLRRSAGFTLVEVMVAMLAMVLLTTLAWQAMDGVLRAREDSRARIDRATRLATVLTQWEQDLQAVLDTEAVPPLAFDGQTLRLTRRGDKGVVLVAWAVRGGKWQRWAGPAVTRAGELSETWLRSQQLQGTEPGQVTLLEGASTWQVYFNLGGNWANAQSTGNLVAPVTVVPAAPPPAATPASGATSGTAATPAANPASAPAPSARYALPDAVRLQITLDGQVLTRDIALGPAGS